MKRKSFIVILVIILSVCMVSCMDADKDFTDELVSDVENNDAKVAYDNSSQKYSSINSDENTSSDEDIDNDEDSSITDETQAIREMMESGELQEISPLPDTTQATSSDPKTALKDFAKSIKCMYVNDVLGNSEGYKYRDVRFKMCDISGDGTEELIAVGFGDTNNLGYMEVFYYNNGLINKIFNCNCGAAGGRFSEPVMFRNKPYIMYEKYSSADGFMQRLMNYNGNEWYDVYSSYQKFDYENRGGFQGYYINEKEVTLEEYESHRNEVKSSYMTSDDFVTASEL